MGTDKQQQNNSADDIDLINLMERMFLFLRRYRIAFIIAILAGISLGCFAYYSSGKIYKSRLILHSSVLTNSEQIEIIDYWDELLKSGEYISLAQSLNCSEALLHTVASIEGAEILKNYSATNPNGFYVDVKVTDNSVLPELQKTIVNGLNNTEYVKQKSAAKEQKLNELIKEITIEIRKLDSTKTSIENIISNKEKNSSSFMIDVSGVNKELIDLNEKLLNYREELKFISGVQVLQSFIPLNTPISISLKVMILLGLILCLSITYILALLNSVWYRLKKRASSNA